MVHPDQEMLNSFTNQIIRVWCFRSNCTTVSIHQKQDYRWYLPHYLQLVLLLLHSVEHTSNWRKVSQHSDTYLVILYSVSYLYLEFPKHDETLPVPAVPLPFCHLTEPLLSCLLHLVFFKVLQSPAVVQSVHPFSPAHVVPLPPSFPFQIQGLQTDGSYSLNIHLHLLSKSFSWHLSEPKIGIILYDFYKVYNLNIKSQIFDLCNAAIATFISCHNNVCTV